MPNIPKEPLPPLTTRGTVRKNRLYCPEENIQRALQLIRNGVFMARAARIADVPQKRLEARVKDLRKKGELTLYWGKNAPKYKESKSAERSKSKSKGVTKSATGKTRKTKARQRCWNYSSKDVASAADAVQQGLYTIHAAHNVFKVPIYIIKRVLKGEPLLDQKEYRIKNQLLTGDEEQILADYALKLNMLKHPVTMKTIIPCVNEILQQRNKKLKDTYGWYKVFLRHHSELSDVCHLPKKIKTVSRTDSAQKYFDRLTEVFDTHKFYVKPSRIYACHADTFFVERWEKSCNLEIVDNVRVQLLVATNASGYQVLPPCVVYKDESEAIPDFMGLPEAAFVASSNGTVTAEILVEWFQTVFLHYIPSRSTEDPVVLILQGSNYWLSPRLLTMAEEEHIHLVLIDTLVILWLQPMMLLLKNLKATYSKDIDKFKKANSDLRVNQPFYPILLGKIFASSFNMSEIQAAYKTTGIYPLDPNEVDVTKLSTIRDVTIIEDSPPILMTPWQRKTGNVQQQKSPLSKGKHRTANCPDASSSESLTVAMSTAPAASDATPAASDVASTKVPDTSTTLPIPSTTTSIPNTSTTKPVASTTNPVASTVKYSASTIKPVALIIEPVISATKPVASTIKPLTSSTIKQVVSTPKTVVSVIEPVASTIKLVSPSTKTVASTIKLVSPSTKTVASYITPNKITSDPVKSDILPDASTYVSVISPDASMQLPEVMASSSPQVSSTTAVAVSSATSKAPISEQESRLSPGADADSCLDIDHSCYSYMSEIEVLTSPLVPVAPVEAPMVSTDAPDSTLADVQVSSSLLLASSISEAEEDSCSDIDAPSVASVSEVDILTSSSAPSTVVPISLTSLSGETVSRHNRTSAPGGLTSPCTSTSASVGTVKTNSVPKSILDRIQSVILQNASVLSTLKTESRSGKSPFATWSHHKRTVRSHTKESKTVKRSTQKGSTETTVETTSPASKLDKLAKAFNADVLSTVLAVKKQLASRSKPPPDKPVCTPKYLPLPQKGSILINPITIQTNPVHIGQASSPGIVLALPKNLSRHVPKAPQMNLDVAPFLPVMQQPVVIRPFRPVVTTNSVTSIVTSNTVTPVVNSNTVTSIVTNNTVTSVVTSNIVKPVVPSKTITSIVTNNTATPIVTSNTVTNVIESKTVTPVVTSNTVTPIVTNNTVVTSNTATPIVTSNTVTPIVTSNTVTPIVTTNAFTPIVTNNAVVPVVTSNTVTPVLTSNTFTPAVASNTLTSVKTSNTATLFVTNNTVTNVITCNTATPVVPSNTATATPIVTTDNITPVMTSKTVTTAIASNTVTPLITSNLVTPVVYSYTFSPVTSGNTVICDVSTNAVTHDVIGNTAAHDVTSNTFTPVVTTNNVTPVIASNTHTPTKTVSLVAGKTITSGVSVQTSNTQPDITAGKQASPYCLLTHLTKSKQVQECHIGKEANATDTSSHNQNPLFPQEFSDNPSSSEVSKSVPKLIVSPTLNLCSKLDKGKGDTNKCIPADISSTVSPVRKSLRRKATEHDSLRPKSDKPFKKSKRSFASTLITTKAMRKQAYPSRSTKSLKH